MDFRRGLEVRGLLDRGGQALLRIELQVRKFDADMIIGRTARIDLIPTALIDDSSIDQGRWWEAYLLF